MHANSEVFSRIYFQDSMFRIASKFESRFQGSILNCAGIAQAGQVGTMLDPPQGKGMFAALPGWASATGG